MAVVQASPQEKLPGPTTEAGLSQREAARRLAAFGPNELRRRGGRRWPGELARQLTHPLALLLWAAGALALVAGMPELAIAIVAVILLNAAFAFAQERQAERALEALSAYLPPQATVVRDGHRRQVDARELVPGDVLLVREGDRISADARLIEGALEADMSPLTGESVPVAVVRQEAIFSGTACTNGHGSAVVLATGMQTELGRIAALTERVQREESPLEAQVRRAAWLIAAVAIGVGLAFVPLGVVAGLPLGDAAIFAIGLLVANVPEGLLPTITLALAVGVRALARRGALVKRLSAVETLGSTTVICTDKTGTLTQGRMEAVEVWTAAGAELDPSLLPVSELARSLAACTDAELNGEDGDIGDPTELALLRLAARLGADSSSSARAGRRRAAFPFDPEVKLMSTVELSGRALRLDCKGAPEEVLARSVSMLGRDGEQRALDVDAVLREADRLAERGLRVLAAARRRIDGEPPAERAEVERDLCLLGLVALLDPPRPEVPGAVADCRKAGIRVIVVTGDHPLTAVEIAKQVGILDAEAAQAVVTGDELAAMSDRELDRLLREVPQPIFARASPEAKLRIADSLRSEGNIVAMTGDGVNDAPALRRADIGVAMGRSGTDVAREASTLVLTDDNFATIVAAVEEGRRVYDNIRKFILYIFAHFPPEAVPFLLFALSGGQVPLALTVMQILAIDLGTETLPALALGRESAEPGIMRRRPRPRPQGVISRAMLTRAWLFLGLISAALVLVAFFAVLLEAGWGLGDPTGSGSPLHDDYLRASTTAFLAIVACQVGTAFAARSDRTALRRIGLTSNRLLLWGILFELAVAAAVIYVPPFQAAFGTAALGWPELVLVLPFPAVIVLADEALRWRLRRAP